MGVNHSMVNVELRTVEDSFGEIHLVMRAGPFDDSCAANAAMEALSELIEDSGGFGRTYREDDDGLAD